ncbi:dipeptidase PepE [Aestuariivivens sediminis]|uniref:dipeptidase PepE n=1 Tax=Aestuariivivens sediminis TaxID=2913557 RepID=UPI001F5A4900|nr:dipeptidase PepE [Aestuariivivens sediminis]
MKKIIIASSSNVYGSGFLEYLFEELETFFEVAEDILFIPYARPGGISHDDYTEKVNHAFRKIEKNVIGIHTFENQKQAIKNAKAIFTGGGNTFVLINQLYKRHLIEPLKTSISKGIPYLGTSAGSNICGLNIMTTNDMPIVYPPNFNALGLVHFNINPHYLDPNPKGKHMGETREVRIKEFHQYNTIPVVGLREGSWLRVNGESVVLQGNLKARIFECDKDPYEIDPNTELTHLR